MARPGFLRSTTRGVAGEEALALQHGPQFRLEIGQRLGYAMAHRTGLARKSAAGDVDHDVVLGRPAGDLERLVDDHAQHRAREIGLERCGR